MLKYTAHPGENRGRAKNDLIWAIHGKKPWRSHKKGQHQPRQPDIEFHIFLKKGTKEASTPIIASAESMGPRRATKSHFCILSTAIEFRLKISRTLF